MKAICVVAIAGMLLIGEARGQKPPLLPEKDAAALANEMSGETAKRNLEGIARFHRQRGSKGFHEAAELVAGRLRAYGLSDVTILQFPADGKIFYGTQRSRPAWDTESAELRLIWSEASDGCMGDDACAWTHFESAQSEYLLESYEAEPLVLAEDSESADVKAELVDVGEGTQESDYAGKEVKGKILLVSTQPGAVQDLAVGKFGAVGIVSYAQNQKTAWSGENLDSIRWGHLETFSANKTFAFMVSLRVAHGFQEQLKKGETIRLHAMVKAGQHAGNYEVVTATIPGADAKLKNEEIVFSCHLDHQRPGANDNASGCATILEVARTLQHLISVGRLARPARTMRFVFPPEIEGTLALLNSKSAKTEVADWKEFIDVTGIDGPPMGNPEKRESRLGLPGGVEWTKRVKAVVHMDMVGGGPETMAVFHVTRGPMSLPSFVQDVAWAFAEWVNEESYNFAAGLKAEYPMVEKGGGKEPLRAEYSAYTMGSDHDMYQDSSFGIPAIYLNDWPDRFIHTNLDVPGNIDSTKLKRAGFIGAASGYFLANQTKFNGSSLLMVMKQGQLARQELRGWRAAELMLPDKAYLEIFSCPYERAIESQVLAFTRIHDNDYEGGNLKPRECFAPVAPMGKLPADLEAAAKLKFKRRAEPGGPMVVFGYDYFEAEWAKRGHTSKPKLLEYEGLWGGGEEYAYEVLNLVDGNRNSLVIHAEVSAEYGPVPRELVIEYLKALEEIGVVEQVK